MSLSPLAGKPATPSMLVDVSKLVAAYHDDKPDADVPGQRVAFGTSGHRGSSFARSFNEAGSSGLSKAIFIAVGLEFQAATGWGAWRSR